MSSALLPRERNSSVTVRRSARLTRSGAITNARSAETTVTRESSPSSMILHDCGAAVAIDTEATDNQLGLNTLVVGNPEVSQERGKGEKTKIYEDRKESFPGRRTHKKRTPKSEPVYIIPDVEHKETTFKGRLGYACLNTVLRNKKPACESVFCSRTCRLSSLVKNGLDWVKELGRQNVRDLKTMIQWNEDNHIQFLRMSSEMFPFASHEKHGYSLEYCTDLLKEAGDLANTYGHRLTTHPGQFTQLGSPRPAVIDAAIRELDYHCQMLDLMGIGVDGVMVVHGGGTYGDKATTIKRIKKTISELLSPQVRARLVLENDEMCYNAEELLDICEELDIPLVFDYHHDTLNPSSIPPSEIIKRANAIWKRREMRPKQHLSEPRPGAVTLMERRAHSDRCETLPADLPHDMDLMIEAKDKEQAVLHLYRIYGLAPVNYASLRPPNPNPSKETNGRKSSKHAKVTVVGPQGGDGSDDRMSLDPLNEEVETVDDTAAGKVDPTGSIQEGDCIAPVSRDRQKQGTNRTARKRKRAPSTSDLEETLAAGSGKRPRNARQLKQREGRKSKRASKNVSG